MGRNIQIVSGRNLDEDISFLICWTKEGKTVGGSGQTIKYCNSKKIKVFNIYYESDLSELRLFIKKLVSGK